MNLLDALMSGVGYVGSAIDAPGAYMRGALGGEFGERMGGRELLEAWGVLDENEEGLDGGDVLGFGAEMLLDPLNLATGGALAAVRGVNKGIRAGNRASEGMRAAGAMPEEIARATKFVDDAGSPQSFYMPTLRSAESSHPADMLAMYGDSTLNEHYGAFYPVRKQPTGSPLGETELYADVRNPLNMSQPLTRAEYERLTAIAEGVRNENLGDMLFNDPEHMARMARVNDLGAELESGNNIVSAARRSAGMDDRSPAVRGEDMWTALANYAAPPAEVFRRAGYDALTDMATYPDSAVLLQRSLAYPAQVIPPLQAERNTSPLIAALMANNAIQTGTGY